MGAVSRSLGRLAPPLCALAGALSLALLSASSCGYTPDFANDQLQCGDNHQCPKGYTCAGDNRCWKTGSGNGGGTGGSGGGNDAGGTDSGTDPQRLANFVGTWTFTGGTLNATCTDAAPLVQSLTGDYMVLSAPGVGLLEQYYCPAGWNLRLPAGSNTAVGLPNLMCTLRTTDSGTGITTTYTWTAIDLSFTTTNGQTATASGHIMGPFTASDGTSGSCNVTFNGPLTKS